LTGSSRVLAGAAAAAVAWGLGPGSQGLGSRVWLSPGSRVKRCESSIPDIVSRNSA
jgi:hypothetical protein